MQKVAIIAKQPQSMNRCTHRIATCLTGAIAPLIAGQPGYWIERKSQFAGHDRGGPDDVTTYAHQTNQKPRPADAKRG